jgi:predicted nucleic acid-binding protein
MFEVYGPMVLVDTSIWIRSLAQKQPYTAELDRLLARDEVSGHQLVYGELLIGDRGGRQKFLESYERIHQAPVIPHQEIVKFVRKRRLHGLGIGWIDAHLLASAIVGNLKLWTVDTYVSALAKEFNVAYEVPGTARA